ncbi:MAG: alpha/beta fold hydrolase [Pseudomonadota bacterium]
MTSNDASKLDNRASEREVELEIVSSSWLSLSESSGFDQMVESWARKVDMVGDRTLASPSDLFDQILARQLEPIERMLAESEVATFADPLREEVEARSVAAMALTPDGSVAAISPTGEGYFALKQGSHNTADWVDERSLADWNGLLRSQRDRGNAAYAILRTCPADGSEGLAEAQLLWVDRYNASFIVVRSLEIHWPDEVNSQLAQAFGLTPSECEICKLLYELRDLERICEKRGVTLETGRTQLKRIFAKTEIHSRVELVRLLAMLCARASEPYDPTDLTWSDPTGNETILERPDGRKLAYTTVGDPSGRTVLHIHGEIAQFFLPQQTQYALAQANVRMVCLSMPGHGASDPPPKGVTQFDDGCAAIAQIVEHLGEGPLPVVATYSALSYPLVLGCDEDGPFSAVVMIGLPWTITPDAYKQLPGVQKAFSQIARYAPKLLDMVGKIGFRSIQRDGPDFYLERAYSAHPIDVATRTDANLQPLLRLAVKHLVTQGWGAWVRECTKHIAVGPTVQLQQIKIPFHWLVGEKTPTNSAANCEAARGDNPLISVEVVPDAGALLAYQRPDVFVSRLHDLAAMDPAKGFMNFDDARHLETDKSVSGKWLPELDSNQRPSD